MVGVTFPNRSLLSDATTMWCPEIYVEVRYPNQSLEDWLPDPVVRGPRLDPSIDLISALLTRSIDRADGRSALQRSRVYLANSLRGPHKPCCSFVLRCPTTVLL